MTPEKFEILFQKSWAQARDLCIKKGGEYAPNEDRLDNFKSNGKALGLPPEAVHAVYMGKHWNSIQTYVADLVAGKDRERTEPIEGRYMDMLVYCFLGIALVEDRNPMVDPKVLEIGRAVRESVKAAAQNC